MARRRKRHERPADAPAVESAQGELLAAEAPRSPVAEAPAAAEGVAAVATLPEPEASPAPDAAPDGPAAPEPDPESPPELVVFELVEEPRRRDPAAEREAPAETHAGQSPQGERLARARELTAQGRPDAALALYREIVQDAPRNVKARHSLGVLYDGLGQHELALEQLEAARALEPEGVEVLTSLGAVLGALGRYDDAERELRRAQRLAPEEVAVRASLGILFFRRGLYAQAEQELRWVCDHDPDHGPAHFYRGEALNRLGRVDPALEVLERAVRLQPHNHRAYFTMGILFDRKNLREEAAAMYRKSRELQRR